MTGILIKKEKLRHRHTGKMPYEDEGSDWGDTSANQGKAKVASNPQKLGERNRTDSSSQTSEGTKFADTLILDF